ncbi:HAD family hydrolase [Fodinicola feengrottensis]|uniref:HAD family phosphatase n=1 Tax=Fodinicola feengrottensis TaxID=435914 RepID=A0ABN2H400_9ACTN|nr:HAD family hydrolase [Fodinicola feengrottensis]
MTLDAVIFDWGGTLTPWHVIDVADSWAVYARAYGSVDADSVTRALAAAEENAWLRSRDEHRSTTYADIVRSAGLEPLGEAHDRAFAAYQEWFAPHTFIDPDVPPLFAALAERGLKVGVLSNTIWPRAAHEEVFARDGILDLIDGAAYTSELPWTKPHPKAFQAAMAAVGATDASRCVFVGDRLFDDVYGSQAVGMKAAWVPHSEIPAWQRGHTEGEPDAVLHRLSELLPAIDQWSNKGAVSG